MKGVLVYGLFDALSGRRVVATLERLLERQSWTSERVGEDVRRRLERLLLSVRVSVPFYREATGGGTTGALSGFPILRRQDILRERDRLVAPEARRRAMQPISSGGSTGAPVTLLLSAATRDAQSAVVLRHQTWMGLPFVCRNLLLWGPPADVVTYGTLTSRAKGVLLRRRFEHTYNLGEEKAALIRAGLYRDCPEQVIGYSSALDTIAAGARPLDRAPRAVVASAEILYPAQRRRIERFFNAPLYERYGSNEFAAIAHGCGHGSLHLNSDRLVLEVLRPDGIPARPGEIGEAIVTDLDNFGMPLIRYQLGDAIELGGSCDCGLPFPTIAAVHGRMADLIEGPGGAFVSPRHVALALEPCGEILEHQVRVLPDGSLDVAVRGLGSVDLDEVSARLGELYDRKVQVHAVDRLSRWPSGKVRPVIREEAAP